MAGPNILLTQSGHIPNPAFAYTLSLLCPWQGPVWAFKAFLAWATASTSDVVTLGILLCMLFMVAVLVYWQGQVQAWER